MPSRRYEAGLPAPVAGVDEAGCGPLAGPVVAAAVILPASGVPRGIDDSKRLSAKERLRLHDLIRARAIVGVAVIEADEIDAINIYQARMKAMRLAVEDLVRAGGREPGHVLVDGNRAPDWRYPASALVGGDGLSVSIAAASIIAKQVRDTIMLAHAETYPHYGWATNMGYGAPAHLKALRDHGPTPLHRRSFAPVARLFADSA